MRFATDAFPSVLFFGMILGVIAMTASAEARPLETTAEAAEIAGPHEEMVWL
ncbi:hypothetical protein C8Q77DRAFT_1159251 [Trametes polyzona]|nr:hypothetical protein C8Q77DRAFT_1159251 [Trametes polyzona]